MLTLRKIVFRLPVKNKRHICCPKRPGRFWGPPNIQFNGRRGTFVPWNEAHHSTHLLVRLRMSTAMLPFLQMPSWCGLERGNLIMYSEPDDHLLVDKRFYADFHRTGRQHIVSERNYGKWLGYLDTKLNWRVHIAKKRKQLALRYRELYWLLGTTSPLSNNNKLLLYKTVIAPIWTYGLQLWGCASKSNIAIIQRFQSKTTASYCEHPTVCYQCNDPLRPVYFYRSRRHPW